MKQRCDTLIGSLDEEIAWWTRQAFATESDAALIAFGVATGLKLAKADYGAKDEFSLAGGHPPPAPPDPPNN